MKLSPVQRQTAKLLSKSRRETVEVTIFGDLDVSALTAFRETMQSGKPTPTITHFVLAALARTLIKHPEFNAHLVENELHLLPQIDIGLAVSIDNGNLVTPVLRDIGVMSIEEIATTARKLVQKARTSKLELSDMKGAGISLSSVGQSPATRFSTPVIVVPQVAILAATAIRSQPIILNGKVESADILPVSLSFDHRALNGVAASAFLQTLADQFNKPEALVEVPGSVKGNLT